ncbi:hypothetical protein [Exercitatus varius]|uniref:hypothetical protein n=1 Tax=Exercitatus varius TaxID=67857 RepID=UPI00294B657B|nr:hypothetical protein [Exercitatus varius]MDG2961682.1 hypothetical protein [Exercitatus varius]
MGFGFIYLLDSPYRDTNNKSYIWDPDFKSKIFCNAKNPFGHDMSVSALFDEMKRVLILRNRLFHHEPIWKKHNCKTHEQAVKNILDNFNFLRKILSWLSIENNELISILNTDISFNGKCNVSAITKLMDDLSRYLSTNEIDKNIEEPIS